MGRCPSWWPERGRGMSQSKSGPTASVEFKGGTGLFFLSLSLEQEVVMWNSWKPGEVGMMSSRKWYEKFLS